MATSRGTTHRPFLRPGQRRVPSLLFLLHGRRVRPGLFAGVIVDFSRSSALDDFSAAVGALDRLTRTRCLNGKTVKSVNFFNRAEQRLLPAHQRLPSTLRVFAVPISFRRSTHSSRHPLSPAHDVCTPSASSSALGRAA